MAAANGCADAVQLKANFAASYQSKVIGQPIASLSLSRVGGASLTMIMFCPVVCRTMFCPGGIAGGAVAAMAKHIERLLGDIAAIKHINPEFFDDQR